MGWHTRYINARQKLLHDAAICPANRDLFREFFEYEERKLKRQNGLDRIDDGCCKTLYGYVFRFRAVNRWFENKPWRDLTRDDIKRVYDQLEDGAICGRGGTRLKDRNGYYKKVFKGKPFRLALKADLAREVIEYSTTEPPEVEFASGEAFRSIVNVVSKPEHLLLLYLAWDFGENIGALLTLKKSDFRRQQNVELNEPEYLLTFRRTHLKRSRKARTEPTLHADTVAFLDRVLPTISDDQPLFSFGHRHALKVIERAATRANAQCTPTGRPVRWKHLRSGMAMHLIGRGWTPQEVAARLGHSPSSTALVHYVNYAAVDRNQSKRKLQQTETELLHRDLTKARQTVQMMQQRIDSERVRLGSRIQALEGQIERVIDFLKTTRPFIVQAKHSMTESDHLQMMPTSAPL